ncbi:MAG TPA: SH3 domain-containing protein [Ramlibacter sp.]|nr:SH3 domain-containing protein [Ramlibacter sp.]
MLLSLGAGLAQAQAQAESAMLKRNAELREVPGDASPSLGALPAASLVSRLGERQGPWVQVRSGAGTIGWVHMFDLGPASGAGVAPAAPAAQASSNAATGALRGLTGLFNKGGTQRPVTSATSTIGIRGLGAEDLAQARPNPGAVAQMETLRQSEGQARQFASEAALTPVHVPALPAPPRHGPADNQGSAQ